MIETIVCVMLGVLVGLFYQPPWLQRIVSVVQKYIVYVLIFFMGVGIGLNEDLVSNVGKIGLGAALFAVLCGVLSAVCTLAIDRALRGRGRRS